MVFWSSEPSDGSGVVQLGLKQLAQTSEPPAITTSSTQLVGFSAHKGPLLGEAISMRYDEGCIVNEVFAVRRKMKINQEAGWCEGDQAQILRRLAPGAVVQTLHRMRRGTQERMLECAVLQARRGVKKEQREEVGWFAYLIQGRTSFEDIGSTKQAHYLDHPAENSSLPA